MELTTAPLIQALTICDDITAAGMHNCLAHVMRREGITGCHSLTTAVKWMGQLYLDILPYPEVSRYLSLVLVHGSPDFVIYYAVALAKHGQDKRPEFHLADHYDYIKQLSVKYQEVVKPGLYRILTST